MMLYLSIVISTLNVKSLLDWLQAHLLACPIKSLSGLDCPGCGFQRSVIALLQGDLSRSVQLYPATIPLIGMGIFAFAHLKLDFKHGALVIKIFYIAISIIILTKYIYKIITYQLI
ncbi:MAG: DUF2752 domain-containing protein [Pedobacter sp.]|nr:DUF2752 domain-containing protein [Pedobacter sp.]MDQ8053515.1 DUF2752 domain-containing protein [Pedobacter sp.]